MWRDRNSVRWGESIAEIKYTGPRAAPSAELVYELYEAQITSRCQLPNARLRGIGPHQGFLAERIVIESAADWVVNDIKIGRASQFAQAGDVPGLAFSAGTLGGAVSFDAARTGIDVALVTTHIGPHEIGAAFVCGILGSIVDLTEIEPAPRHGRILSSRDLR